MAWLASCSDMTRLLARDFIDAPAHIMTHGRRAVWLIARSTQGRTMLWRRKGHELSKRSSTRIYSKHPVSANEKHVGDD